MLFILQIATLVTVQASCINGAREMESGLFDAREDNEHNNIGFAEISDIFTMRGSGFPWQ